MRSLILAISLMAAAIVSAGTWQPLTHPYPAPAILNPNNGNPLSPGGASFPILMTDGSVMVQNCSPFFADGRIFKLTPDSHGSYVGGTWTELAPMPYIQAAAAQAVLADGRVIIEGGEYSGVFLNFLLTNQGAIYNPVTNTWTSVPPPSFFVDLYPPRALFAPHPIGDAASVVLPNGLFMLQDKMSRQAAILNPNTMTWKETGTATKADMNDEEGWTLLPNGQVLTVDCYTDYFFGLAIGYPADPTNSEIYNPATGTWISAGSTINTLTDPYLAEMGPAILRPDGTVLAVGSQGYTSIYNSFTGQWSVGPTLPIGPEGYQLTAQDAPGALLPNGNVLIAASGGPLDPFPDGFSDPPVHFLEFDGSAWTLEQTIPNAANDYSSSVVLLVLPTGQVLECDSTGDVEIYTPDDTGHNPAWEPVIGSVPATMKRGSTYTIYGIRFNGMSQASAFGDELQNATNYPLVRLTSLEGARVVYCRTHNHSSMAVASNRTVSTRFDIPASLSTGTYKLEVVANGIASQPTFVTIKSARGR